jgi:1-deoxy-D-xylulose-5-phosphate reductoisomerase
MAHAPGRFAVEALTAMDNVTRLVEQARALTPALAVIGNPVHYAALKEGLAGTGIEAAAGPRALVDAACRPCDVLVSAMVGAAGLEPTLAAIERGRTVALANKECLVAAGELMMQAVRKHGATLIPVDSEHNAIFQVLTGHRAQDVELVTLTASGGPFRTWNESQMAAATPEQALNHPNWRMGAKITIDSATMMNKALELIEAHHLFALPPEKLAVLVHPESIVHSLVAYRDGSVLAQLSNPDMCTPIAHALAWPGRIDAPVKRLDLAALGKLTFEPPDEQRFPGLTLARRAMQAGPYAPVVLNAANEIAVQAFLEGRIPFPRIAEITAQALETLPARAISSLEDILAQDAQARLLAAELTGTA